MSPGNEKLSNDKLFNSLVASLKLTDLFNLDKQSLTNNMPYIKSLSVGPLISKFLKNEFALNKSKVSSIMS